jgi:hypothetical protein
LASVDPVLRRRVDEALDFGFGCVGDGDHNPFVLLWEASGKGHLLDLRSWEGISSEALLEGGRELIRQYAKKGQYYVLVWGGYLPRAAKRQDAVLAEAGARGQGHATLFAQRYKAARSGALAKVGKPVVVAEVAHLWDEATG